MHSRSTDIGSIGQDYGGVISELVRGEWEEPETGKRYSIPPNDIVIAETLDGVEAELVRQQHDGQSLVVVSDPITHQILGQRIFNALKSDSFDVTEYIWSTPSCSESGVKEVQEATRGREALIAVGSGTINDTVKYASYLDNREYSVFATSPMNAYTTNTASVSFDGFKKSITCHGAKGIYFDLSILAQCPPRLVSAAYADVICRTTAQVDWLMSHLLFGTPYSGTPYTLLSYDEQNMIDKAPALLAGDLDALGMLTRISAIMGLGTSFTETTHSGSMGEHMISHYIDMFAGSAHPGSSHGEQVGVATVTMSQLQNLILRRDEPPRMCATVIPENDLMSRFGSSLAQNMIEQTQQKALTSRTVDQINQRFDKEWDVFSEKLCAVMLPFETLRKSMQSAGCQINCEELGLNTGFYAEAVAYARFIRDRFTILDLAADAGQLSGFVEQYVVNE